MSLVFIVDRLGDIFRVSLTLHGVTSGAMLGIFTLGMLVPWATSKGAIAGGLFSMLSMVWIIVGAQVNMIEKRLIYPPLSTSTEDCLNAEIASNQTTMNTGDILSSADDEPFILFTISFMYYALVGFLISMVVGTIVSFLFGVNDLSEVDRNHFPPIVQRYGNIFVLISMKNGKTIHEHGRVVSDFYHRKNTPRFRCIRYRTRW